MASSDEVNTRLSELRADLEALPEVPEPPKPMLRILGSMRSERKWNTLLAYFLDPSQPHGFDADLLKRFLDKLDRETNTEIEYFHSDIQEVSVNTEVTSPQNNRLDIVIRAPEEWFVCIESKVDAPEEEGKPQRYLEDDHVGNEPKAEYPEEGHHYVFLSKAFSPDVMAGGFEDLYWRHVVEAFQEELDFSHGRYPERSVSQLNDFLSTIITVTNMEEDNFEQIQKEKVQLLSEYRDDIDELFEAAEALRERTVEQWPELFRSQVDDALWTDDWTTRREPREWGCIFKRGWYLDNENLEPTTVHDDTTGNRGFRLHFNHLIRREESFARGQLTYRLRSPTNVDLRDEFHSLYNSDRWQDKLKPLLDDRGITNKGNKRDYMIRTYDVDQSDLPESYFETLADAFKDHLPVAEVVDKIVSEALSNVKEDG